MSEEIALGLLDGLDLDFSFEDDSEVIRAGDTIIAGNVVATVLPTNEQSSDASTVVAAADCPIADSPSSEVASDDVSDVISDLPQASDTVAATASDDYATVSSSQVEPEPERELSIYERIIAAEHDLAELCLQEEAARQRSKLLKKRRQDKAEELSNLIFDRDHDIERTASRFTTASSGSSESTDVVNPLPGQKQLPIDATNPPRDTAGEAKVGSALSLTEKQVEALEEAEIVTVTDLEKAIRDGRFVPGRIKLFGPSKIDKVTDELMKYRDKFPVPSATEAADEPVSPEIAEAATNPVTDPETADAVVSEAADDQQPATIEKMMNPEKTSRAKKPKKTKKPKSDFAVPPSVLAEAVNQASPEEQEAYLSGCEAGADMKPVTANPHSAGTGLWHAWDRGWQECHVEDDLED